MDVAALDGAGIPLCYIPDYCAEEVAEQAIALIFACGRRIVSSRKVLDDSSANGALGLRPADPHVPHGAARRWASSAAAASARWSTRSCKTFGFKFLICDPYLSEERKRELGIETVDLETVFRESDFITIHTPLTPETRHIVNAKTLALMKPTAYLVNTARGPMVDAERAGRGAEEGRDRRRGHRRLRHGAAAARLPAVRAAQRHPHAAPGLVLRGCRPCASAS